MTAGPVEPGVTVIVCVTCRDPQREGALPGRALFDAVAARLADAPDEAVALRSIACLSVCKRPCTVAMTAPGKWTYVVGDLDAQAGAGDVLDAARKFAASADGIIPWRERPLSFRKGVVSRTPPLALAVEEV
jgi:predicted metal-binding protein